MTVIQTITDRARQFPENKPEEFFSAYFDKLTAILFNFREQNDYLSKQLHKWGLQAHAFWEYKAGKITPEIKAKANEHMNCLFDRILVDCLKSEPLLEPVMEEGFVWENATVKDYRAICEALGRSCLSPITNKPLVVKTHDFAKAVLGWAWDLVTEASTNNVRALDRKQADSVPSGDDSDLETRHLYYRELGLNAKKLRLYQELTEECLESTQALFDEKRAFDEEVENTILNCRKQAQRRQQNLVHMIEQTEKTHSIGIQELNTRLNAQDIQIDELNTKIEAARKRCQLSSQQIYQLQKKYHELQVRLYNAQNSGKHSCSIL